MLMGFGGTDVKWASNEVRGAIGGIPSRNRSTLLSYPQADQMAVKCPHRRLPSRLPILLVAQRG